MYRNINLALLVMLIAIMASPSVADEVLWGSGGGGGVSGGILGWPTLERFGGTGRPTKALFVVPNLLAIHNAGLGQDQTGSVWTNGCTVGPDATTDLPCIAGGTAELLMDVTVARAGVGFKNVTVDGTAPGFASYCRNSVSFIHETGTALDTPITASGAFPIPSVMRDQSAPGIADVYRLFSTDLGSSAPTVCSSTSTTTNLNVRSETLFASALTDDVMVFSSDSISRSPYGGRWSAQEVLNADFESQYPEVMGVENLIAHGYQENDCTGNTAPNVTISGSATLVYVPKSMRLGTPFLSSFLGLGCKVLGTATNDTLTWSSTPATLEASERYYTGQIYAGTNEVTVNVRSSRFRIQDQSGNILPASDVKWWLEASGTGRRELLSQIDPASMVAVGAGEEVHLPSAACYGGCILSFTFKIADDDTGFALRYQDTVEFPSDFIFDEIFIRKKVYADLNRHPIIMDGQASLALVTDGLEPSGNESIVDAFDYMLGYPTSFETTAATSSRPNLFLRKPPSEDLVEFDGARLGDIVGDWDSNRNYQGDPNTQRLVDKLGATNYCVNFMGNEDPLGYEGGGEGSRPTSSALASDSVANRYLYFKDQIKGFEQSAESMGCIPIVVLPYPNRALTATQKYCATQTGTAENCGDWWLEMTKNILHNGME